MAGDLNYSAYNEHAERYVSHNIGGTTGGLNPQQRVARFQKFLPQGRILEVGTGEGLDAVELQRVGYEVIASDFVESFLEMEKDNNLNVIKLDLKNDEIPADIQPLNGVFANAVFVHFNIEDFKKSLEKIKNALVPNGYIYFSVMLGEGTEIAGRAKGIEREFFYYNEEVIRELLATTGYTVDLLEYPIDTKWMHVIAHSIER